MSTLFKQSADLECGDIEASALGGHVQICERDAGGLHVMLNVKEARALRQWLDTVLPEPTG